MLDAELMRMKMTVLGLNPTYLATLAGVPPGKVSLFVNGTRPLRNDEVIRLRGVLDDVEKLIQVADPFPLNFKNIGRIKDLIDSMKRGELRAGKDHA